jgi:V/A-type H+-transporting ATPase subunit A
MGYGALWVELGPGLLGNIYDGVQRPLPDLALLNEAGVPSAPYIARGLSMPPLDRQRHWRFAPAISSGDRVVPGSLLGTVAETKGFHHRILVPPTARQVEGWRQYPSPPIGVAPR